MAQAEVLPTAFDLAFPERKRSKWSLPSSMRWRRAGNRPGGAAASTEDDPEFKLPKLTSLVIVLVTSGMLQISFFIIVSSSNAYAQHLGGTSTFSGLVIGIPTVFSGVALLPLLRLDQGGYRIPMHFACASALLGHILYALAYPANFLYLILIGRIVSGFALTYWMYSKRYCSDHRIVGLRRRTTLAGYLVLGQGIGFSLGPFIGGLLYKIGFGNTVFNGFTSPAWIMAAIWAVWWVFAATHFEDVPRATTNLAPVETAPVDEMVLPTISAPQNASALQVPESSKSRETIKAEGEAQVAEVATPTNAQSSAESLDRTPRRTRMTTAQFGVIATMCWFAMTCFFILGAFESNIPVFTAPIADFIYGPHAFNFSPYAAGNLIALGGVCTFPFLLANVFFARRLQDRFTLLAGTATGMAGLLVLLGTLAAREVTRVALFFAWFLVALGFNLASTVTLSLLSKQLPAHWNTRISVAIQYSNYTGRVTGAVWGGAGVAVGMETYVGLEIAIVGIGIAMFSVLWRQLKAKTG
ncbi:MFS general substrate transporter [Phanerochaete sordida]|uniref:MFS general substrate transporter n=1 Tax=Phanerochaete sordida TaxID=48140 RepID=A0A9P3GE62_9APHY|nr:MFS general substrate transporter [Phanerochaete sordida]